MATETQPTAPLPIHSSLSLEPHVNDETERKSPYIVRKVFGSLPGRIVMSSLETLRATGTGVVYLSSWGDSCPVFLPNIRFRDVGAHIFHTATAGVTAVFSPCVDMDTGVELSVKVLHMVKKTNPSPIKIMGSKDKPEFKRLTIRIKYKHIMTNATLQYFRSSKRKDGSFGGSVKSYLATDKGWFAPYLFATGRRPIIARYKKADVIYCRGPFIKGDSDLGRKLLEETRDSIILCNPPVVLEPSNLPEQGGGTLAHSSRSEITLASPSQSVQPAPPTLIVRRLVILLVGLKPYRMSWSSSARPSESIIQYKLCKGCPAIVVPAKADAPLLAWSTLTLKQLRKLELPGEAQVSSTPATSDATRDFEGVVTTLCEYLDRCVDWERVVPEDRSRHDGNMTLQEKKNNVRGAVAALVEAAVRTRTSKKVKRAIDSERCGIAIWRIS